MKNLLLALLFISPFALQAQKVRSLSDVMELKMPKTKKDLNSGTNGSSVIYNPSTRKYYASFAGNATYPLAVFNTQGKRISSENLKGRIDMRGMWYNRKLRTICGKVHGKKGWFRYELSDNGIPTAKEIYIIPSSKSSSQQVAAYNVKKDLVYLLNGQIIKAYNANGKENEDAGLRLHPGITNKDDIDDTNKGRTISSAYNSSVLIYTGIRKAEFGILNYSKKQIELYNKRNGLLTQILKLPQGTKTYDFFNFSYADDLFWLYNQNTRTWIGFE